ncbi:hypothetical protein ILYODFUR_004327 [Ilyodon furcidens]|uniref:Uncharacterized protein n=1 Tax=Ilyodon furcidens TaxID=33524 RepID=A0ABV0VCK5_9TELE
MGPSHRTSLNLSPFLPSSICPFARLHSGAVDSTVALQQEGPGFRLSASSLHVLHVHVSVLSEYSSFLPQYQNVLVRI